jgi:aspartate aminotransferase
MPQGGFYLFPDFAPVRNWLGLRDITTSVAFCEQLLDQTGVAVLPGSAFGRPADELTVRISFVDFDGARAMEAARELPRNRPPDERFLQDYCANTLTAVDRLREWLAS